MALFPCDATGHRYSGPQRTMYPAVSSGALSHRRKLRLCKEHFDGFCDQLQTHAIDAAQPADTAQLAGCYLCDQPVAGTSTALYVTLYDQAAERQDWYAPVHDNCADGTMADWQIQPEAA